MSDVLTSGSRGSTRAPARPPAPPPLPARSGGRRRSISSAFLGGFVLSFAAGAVGAARELPMPVPRASTARAIAAGVSVAAGVVVALCAVLAALMLLLHLSDVDALARPARAGA